MRQTLSKDSQCWRKAFELLEQQPGRRAALDRVFKKSPASGLYADEKAESFPVFVAHVCRILARSPRTVLRQAVDVAYQLVRAQKGDPLKELFGLLQLLPTTGDINNVVAAVKSVDEGTCFRRLERLNLATEVRPSTMEELEKTIRRSMQAKQKDVSEEQIIRAIENAKAKQEKRRQDVEQKILHLQAQLRTDGEYLRYNRVRFLWEACGGSHLWTNCQAANRAISQGRGKRGQEFERSSSDICASMIAIRHQKGNPHSNNAAAYSFERNLHWWCKGKPAGEIDLMVLCNSRPIAICEMKKSAFEIARATQQHAAKLAAALRESPSNEWRVGETLETAMRLSGEDMDFYVATVLPDNLHRQIGADPSLANAVCEGIRAQYLGVAHPSTIPLCQPIAELLVDPSGPIESIVSRAENMAPMTPKEWVEIPIDHDLLNRYVAGWMGSELLAESPRGCLSRLSSRVLLLPRYG